LREKRDKEEREKKKVQLRELTAKEKQEMEERRKQEEMQDYGRIMVEENMVSNKSINKSVQEFEDDFM